MTTFLNMDSGYEITMPRLRARKRITHVYTLRADEL